MKMKKKSSVATTARKKKTENPTTDRITAPQTGLLFETSWEVCNKVGGIYTVLSTKANVLEQQFGDRLVFIGPDVWTEQNPSPVFKENKRLLKSSQRFLNLPYGISIRTGYWDVPGSPIAVLVKFDGVYEQLDSVFSKMWQEFGVDSLHAYGDYHEGCAFAVASAIVIKAITERLGVNAEQVLAHFNEWTTAMGLLYLRTIMPEAATLFTTHATSIGRSICGNGKELYEYFSGYNGDQMARELNMESKHSLEKTAAHQADCFTAVSEVTARECEQLLDIRPQVVTPNGFEPRMVPSAERRAALRAAARQRLLEVASRLAGRQISEDALIVATSGRNEFRNKGIDLFLDAVGSLRAQAGSLPSEVVALVLTPAWVKEPSGALLVDEDFHGELHPEPDFLTHRLNNEDSDSIVCKIRSMGGNNPAVQGSDKVTVIDVPCYLDGHDGIIDIAYYDLLPGLDLTVFPSYYEPWGYTPLESIAFGVPTVTTDKAGFGQWILENFTNGFSGCGAEVLPRTDRNYSEDVERISDLIISAAAADAATREEWSRAAVTTSRQADWSIFIKEYDKAFRTAAERRDNRLKH